ncbi:UDP-N-acetylmuramoyl-L-alanyl-D-glutamate--2,6-diaminopimelate ligase [Arundinibacter roseus]|uniref:UDP-N-acetylmuramoyl-L-alanyl-D-glutamate--2,6-diaminopimelate ligase n=1 Tax=Arundinibacter roseus TaxID=2070510 RepID=A0A4R4KKZ2_9BACT|nr:UDP-N-acetylmuramoyl-L-alanyl-D-glutamate--2,6-diaminopimelate ligase [Arundinibacter roseus]TDB68974.1 UDP-N-acetylmuramoyl-L-alanyl-D-glutamate--2,6-diaminopimelate ligase [Arundinibacter roseus]
MENPEKTIQLLTLLEAIPDAVVVGSTQKSIQALSADSRKVQSGTLFIAVPGTQTDGHDYIPKAIELGAAAVLCEALPAQTLPHVTYIQVVNSALAMGLIASAFYGHPSREITLVGVTGTNGKTSVATLLFNLFRELGYRCGLLSTVQNQMEDEVIPTTHTTPDSLTLQALLEKMKQNGCSHVFMEVSSHAVVQQRIAGLTFAGGIFTNISHDHLDFHKTFDHYIKAKKGFFDQLPKHAFALVNIDDRRGTVMVQNCAARVETYSLQTMASFKGKIHAETLFGMHMDVNDVEVWFRLIGRFNAYNLLAVYGAAILLGQDPDAVLSIASDLRSAPGRFEQIRSPQDVTAIVDYAHTPDALQNVLETIAHLRTANENERMAEVITVVGCGGNRDAEKRPKMAAIACELSSRVFLTSDNPRHEEPQEILDQMLKGVPPQEYRKVTVLADRREAIQRACAEAQPGDIVLVAGKGHETYQEIKGVKFDFDDKAEVRRAFGMPENG